MANANLSSFLNLFPEISFPCTLTEKQAIEIGSKPERIPVDLARAFICEVPGSSLIGEATAEMTESEGLYILDAFVPVGKFRGKNFWGVLYCLSYLGDSEVALASYSEAGNLISRIHFAGSDSDLYTLDGQLFAQGAEVKIAKKEFEEGDKGKEDAELATLERRIFIGEQGAFLDHDTDKVIGDEF